MSQVDTIYISSSKSNNPVIGEVYYDQYDNTPRIWDGKGWQMFSWAGSNDTVTLLPTDEQLKKYPTLKRAWEEYLIIRKLIGV
ncbi:MAG TPA: hypothetical protein VIY47_02535 [Ignavibacteriaceae bacterium]